MAASAWSVNKYGKLKIGQATINLTTASTAFRLALYQGAASANIAGDISIQSSVGNEVAQTGGYTTGGEAMTGISWTLSNSVAIFDSTAVVVTGSIANVKYAYIVYSAGPTSGHLLCYSQLSDTQFAVGSGNTLTITPNTAGIFTLT